MMIPIHRPPKLTDKFKVGDRVRRLRDVFQDNGDYLVGEVVEVYSGIASKVLGGFKYDELYAVHWDGSDEIRYSYLPHGLEGQHGGKK